MENFGDLALTVELLGIDWVRQGVLAAAILGLVAGVVGPLIVQRKMAFAVHGTAELGFTGAAGALVIFGASVGYGSAAQEHPMADLVVPVGAIAGAVIAALLLGLLGGRADERDSVIGVVLSFGLGLGVLLLWLYPGRASNKFGLLVGQVMSVDSANLAVFVASAVLVLGVLAVIYRPLLFASVDPVVAAARGVPLRLLTPVFAVLVGVATALGVQTVGVLLVLALLVTPAAAACRVTSSPLTATLLAVVFAETAVLGGIVLSLAPGAPISAFVTTISFVIYLGCRAVERVRLRGARTVDMST